MAHIVGDDLKGRDLVEQFGIAVDQAEKDGGLGVWLRNTLFPVLDGLRLGTQATCEHGL